jgi:hypothetical protein
MIAKAYTFLIKIPAYIVGIVMFSYYVIAVALPLRIRISILERFGKYDRRMKLARKDLHDELPRIYAIIVMIPWHIAGWIIAAYFAITLGIPYLIKGIVQSVKNKEPIMRHAYNYAYNRYITSEHIFTM